MLVFNKQKTYKRKANSVIVTGGKRLKGTVTVQGSKNATLPILASSLLLESKTVLLNVPDISDVRHMLEIMRYLGATYTFSNNVVTIDCQNIKNKPISEELTTKIRASSLLLGPLLARFGSCTIGMPGGCSIGNRPLNYHLNGLEKLNSDVMIQEDTIYVSSNSLCGDYTLEFPSVGATQNLINASIFTKEKVIIRNIAVEPEVISMINFLRSAGANIILNKDKRTVEIHGGSPLKSTQFEIPFDRIEAGTLLCAAFATEGEITLQRVNPTDMSNYLQTLIDMGAIVDIKEDKVTLRHKGMMKGASIGTGVHPAFPTDLQPLFSVLMTKAKTISVISETIFNNRFRHLHEIMKLGATIDFKKNTAIIYPSSLFAGRIQGYDLRGTATMIIAGLISNGTTIVDGLDNLYRGYESLIEKLEYLGADIHYTELCNSLN